MSPVDALTRLGGVSTSRELRRLTSRRRLRTALRNGQVVRVSTGVYALPGCEAAKLAAARVGGVVSHLSAAQHYEWPVKLPPKRPTITVPRRRSQLDADGLEVHWATSPRSRYAAA